jgi:hypothetical protein
MRIKKGNKGGLVTTKTLSAFLILEIADKAMEKLIVKKLIARPKIFLESKVVARHRFICTPFLLSLLFQP